jgi:hypothetical protein
MIADAMIANSNTGTGAILFCHGGAWTTEGGTLTIRNNTGTGAGSLDVVLTNTFLSGFAAADDNAGNSNER